MKTDNKDKIKDKNNIPRCKLQNEFACNAPKDAPNCYNYCEYYLMQVQSRVGEDGQR